MRRIRLLILTAPAIVSCAPIVGSTLLAGRMVEGGDNRAYLVQTQALRLNAGLSMEEFHEEMLSYAPDEYSSVLLKDIEAEARRRMPREKWRKEMTPREIVRLSPELNVKYERVEADRDAARDGDKSWTLRWMTYRAIRLDGGAKEADVVAELLATDLRFEARFGESAQP